jgi:lauroyl/myristoyl acyltransferase
LKILQSNQSQERTLQDKKTIIWPIQAAVFYLFTLAFALLPERFTGPAGQLIGRMSAFLIRRRRTTAIENINLALPAMLKKPDWNFPRQSPEEIAS